MDILLAPTNKFRKAIEDARTEIKDDPTRLRSKIGDALYYFVEDEFEAKKPGSVTGIILNHFYDEDDKTINKIDAIRQLLDVVSGDMNGL